MSPLRHPIALIHCHSISRYLGVFKLVNDSFSGQQISIPPVKPRGNTRTDIVAGYHGNVSVRRDVFVVGLEEHDHFYPVRLNPTPVWPEEVTASTEVTLDLRSCSLVAKSTYAPDHSGLLA